MEKGGFWRVPPEEGIAGEGKNSPMSAGREKVKKSEVGGDQGPLEILKGAFAVQIGQPGNLSKPANILF